MRRKRLISLLLTAALAATSMSAAMATTIAAAGGTNTSAGNGRVTIDINEGDMLDADENALTATRISSYSEGNKYIRLYDRNNNWAGLNIITNAVTLEADKEYYFSFDVRTHTDHKQLGSSILGFHSGSRLSALGLSVTGAAITNDGNYVTNIGNTWATVEIPYNNNTGAALAKMQNLNFIGQTNANQSNPFDFDNFSIYYYDGDEKVYAYREDFQDETVGAVSDELSNNFRLFLGSWKGKYIVEEDQPYYAAGSTTSVSYTPAESLTLNPGIYNLNAQFAYPDYDTSKLTIATNNAITADGNAFDIAGKLVLGDGSTYTTDTVHVGNQWTDVNISFVLKEATTLESLTYTLGAASELIVRNVSIECQGTEAITGLSADNYLEGAVATYSGIVDAVDVKENTALYIGERTQSQNNEFFTVQFSDNLYASKTYYVSFDIQTADGSTIMIRPRFGAAIREADAGVLKGADYGLANEADADGNLVDVFTHGMNGNYLVYTQNSELKGLWNRALDNDAGGNPKYLPWKRLVLYNISGKLTHFEGFFTPKADISSGKVVISRGTDPAQTQPLLIDNIKVWNESGAVIYQNTFESGSIDTKGAKLSTTASVMNLVTQSDYSMLTPVNGDTASIEYDTSAISMEGGTYGFGIELAAADAGASGTAQIEFTFSDGSTKRSNSFAITDQFATVSAYVKVKNGVTITSISVVTDLASPLNFRNAALKSGGANDGGIPDVGIIMVLLAKMQEGVKTRVVKKEFIEDGDFEANVVIHDIGAAAQTAETAGWYARMAENQATKLTLVTQGDNSFLRVSDLNMSQRGVYFNTGVVLPAGTYQLSVDLRVSEAAADANYTAYKWRSTPGTMQYMRVNMQNPDNMGLPHYAPNNAPDKDTFFDSNGNNVGWGKEIKKEWTTYTDKIVLEEDTLCVLKIGGYTGGEVDSHGFDIDNLSIIGEVTIVTGTPAVDEATEAEDAAAK